MDKYDDIINLERHVSKVHEKMSIESRSAQFAPYSALTGYDKQIEETIENSEERAKKQ